MLPDGLVHQRLPKDFVLPTKLFRYDIRVNDDDDDDDEATSGMASYPKSRLLKIRGIEATSLVAFKALCEKSGVEYLKLREIKGCCQNMVPSIDETGLNELKRLSLRSFDELECIVDTTQQQDVAFSNLVDLSIKRVGLREICSGGRPPRGFLENLETLEISSCARMSCLFPSWVLIQSLRKLKKVTVEWCDELEDVFQLEGLCYAKENPFLLSSLKGLYLDELRNLRYIWKGPTQQISLQSLTIVEVEGCNKLRYIFTLSLARSLLQLEQLRVKNCGSLEHIVEIKEVEENVAEGGGNDVIFPKLRKLQLDGLEDFISFCSQNYSSTFPALQELNLNLPLNSITSFVANVLQTSNENGKLVLSKQKPATGRDDSWTSISESECVEGHMRKFGIEKGECSKFRMVGKGPNLNGLQAVDGLHVDGSQASDSRSYESEDSTMRSKQQDSPNRNRPKNPSLPDNIQRYNKQRVASGTENIKNLNGGQMTAPIQLPFRDESGVQIRGEDLQEVPLVVELDGSDSTASPKEKHDGSRPAGFYWSLEEEIAKVIEKGVALGRIVMSRNNAGVARSNRSQNPDENGTNRGSGASDTSWNLEEEVTKVIEVGKAVGFDFNGKEHELQDVTVRLCDELEDVFQLEGLSYAKENPILLSSLKGLYLDELRNLRYIWKGPTQQISLQSLTIVEVERCNKLRYIFTLSLARSLLQLEQLRVKNCGSLEHIVEIKEVEENVAEGGGNDVIFPKLRKLQLDGLEDFISFCSQNYSSTFPALQELNLNLPLNSITSFVANVLQTSNELQDVTVRLCDELEDVFQLEGLSYAKENPILLSSLKGLYLDELRNLRYIWKGPTQQISLQSLTIVEVERCNKLRYIFTLSLARSLLQLEQLRVKNCGSLEHIVEIKEVEENVAEGGGNDVIFPKLRKLQLDGLENFINFCSQNYSSTFPALQELSLYLTLNSTTSFVAQLEATVLQTSKEKLRVLEVGISDHLCNTVLAQLKHGFQNLEELKIRDCTVQVLSQLQLSLPSLKVLDLSILKELECLCKGPTHLLSLPNLKKLSVIYCNRLRHVFSISLARNFMQLEELIISDCGELEQIFIEESLSPVAFTLLKDHLQSPLFFPNLICWCDHLQLPLLFPNLSSIDIRRCNKLKCMFPVSMAHLLSLQNLTTLKLDTCQGPTHLFSSALARNLLQLESIDISYCKELEQIIVEDHTQDDHVQLGLFPNLSSISVKGCGKLKTLFPAVTIARSGLQKLKALIVESSSQLEELFEHKDEADMTSDKEMVLPQLEKLTLQQLASLINFSHVGYHFIFPSLSRLVVTECPKLTTRFSIDQNRSVHAEAKAPQTGKEDVDMKQSPLETTKEIYGLNFDALQKRLPPYTGK
ncbi:hypothetical protein Q3G72_009996 [Acer saccharum]|nr:hypothetical protein Q3G72_009996 [Acer saccharum]